MAPAGCRCAPSLACGASIADCKETDGALGQRDIAIDEQNAGKLHHQFLVLLVAAEHQTERHLAATSAVRGGLILAVTPCSPKTTAVYSRCFNEVLGRTPLAAAWLNDASAGRLCAWQEPCHRLPATIVATLLDGEEAIVAAPERCWPSAPHELPGSFPR
jgi:hypothetical protein